MNSISIQTLKLSSSSPSFPTAREGHSLTYIDDLDRFIMFGGGSASKFNDTYILDDVAPCWSKLEDKGAKPLERYYHSAWYDKPYFFIFGGKLQSSQQQADTHCFILETGTWKKVFALEFPPMRDKHCMRKLPGSRCALLFGGYSTQKNSLLSDIWIFNYGTHINREVDSKYQSN